MYKKLVFASLLLCGCATDTSNSEQLKTSLPRDTTTTMNVKASNLSTLDGAALIFYNVENLFDISDDLDNRGDDEFLPTGDLHWDKERYEDKISKVSEALMLANGKAPMMIGLAEVENYAVLEKLASSKAFDNANYKIVHYDSDDSRGIDVALLYDDTKFMVTKTNRIKITIEEQPNYKTRDILHVKGFFAGNIETHVFVNHWSSRREGQQETESRRISAARILRQQIDDIQNEDPAANIIVMGDFNDTPLNKSLKQVLKAKSPKEKTNASELTNLMYEQELADEGTIKFRGDWMVFDQIMVSRSIFRGSNGLSLLNKEAKIIDNEKLMFFYKNGDAKPNSTYGGNEYYGGYSDHLPVYLILNCTK